jgi:hypothetical protein
MARTNVPTVSSIASPAERAFSRLFRLVTWVGHQAGEFTFEDVRAALGDEGNPVYVGTHDAVDRKWSRDKLAMCGLGMTLVREGADAYRYEGAARAVRLPPVCAGALVAAVRRLPVTGDTDLEVGLRKLLAAGAPILGALIERDPWGRSGIRREPTMQLLTVAYLLLQVLDAAGEDGLAHVEARVATGARDHAEMVRVVRLLSNLRLPYDPPDDDVPLALDKGRIALYRRGAVLPELQLTARERSALADAGIFASTAMAA